LAMHLIVVERITVVVLKIYYLVIAK
jgi:hypothetical protein